MMSPHPEAIATATGNILIVDDDHDFAESLEEYLELHGYRIRTAHDLAHAEEAVNAFDPQVVLVDMRLGNSRGTDLIAKVKEEKPDLLFVVMTAYADTDTAIEALKRGAYDYLRKPFNLEVLNSTIHRCFRNLRLQEEKEQALERLKANEERFRKMIEGSVQGIAIHRDLTPLFVNPAFAKIIGYASSEELLALPSLDPLVGGEDLERLRGELGQALQSGEGQRGA